MASSPQFNPYNSIYTLLQFHKIDRDIYVWLITHDTALDVARNVVALLAWLSSLGVEVISYFRNNLNNPFVFLRLTAEAEYILDLLRRDSPPRYQSALVIPIIDSLSTRNLDINFFYLHRHEGAERIAEILAVGCFIFDDELFATFRRYEAAMDDARRRNAASPPMPSELQARPLPISLTTGDSVDERSLSITFLTASALTQREIEDYFHELWGDCVEYVAFEEMASSSSARSRARVVFKKEGYVALMLHNRVEFSFAISGKQVLARRLVE